MSVGPLQKHGVAEGRVLSELRAMARAAGEECPAFTPPGGETLDQVRSPGAGHPAPALPVSGSRRRTRPISKMSPELSPSFGSRLVHKTTVYGIV